MFGYEWTKSFWVRPDHLITIDCLIAGQLGMTSVDSFQTDWYMYLYLYTVYIYNVIRTDEHPHLSSLSKICRNLKLMT